jgi:plastocyanin
MHQRHRRPWLALLGAMVVVGSFVAGCGNGPSTSGAGNPSGPPAAELSVGTDSGNELRFIPSELVAPPDALVRVTLHNASTQAHNLTFENPIHGGTRTIVEAGASDAVDIVTPGPGTYRFVCTIHVGMSGTLEVR